MAEYFTEANNGYSQGLWGCMANPVDCVFSWCLTPCAFGEWYGRRRESDEFTKNAIIGTVLGWIPIVNFFFLCQERKSAQGERGADLQSDVELGLLSFFCSCCVISQERSLYNSDGKEPKLVTF
ncbi:hypothetical protein FVE85_5086 [Porphyridium purpureum]|uniref:Uncharacterized protein n=1 Tax=Porphyridium purpureum TaxID=35688 RepID=A0A5J4Z0V2_PORPP|nr:hypothetical protein FVE85_5086 [Porphyridium purpureum]|eukprot:POR6306..scf295_1